MPIIPYSRTFDQSTLSKLLDHDPVVQRYRAFLALFDWSVVPESPLEPSPASSAHGLPQSAPAQA